MDNKISINKIIADIKATKGNRSGCQGLSSSLESDGYITSICKWVRATSPDRINALVEHVEKQDAALITWEKTMMEACGEDGPASVANEIRSLRALRDTALTELRAQVVQLAAENVALKKFCKNAAFDADYEAELGMERGGFTDALNNIETPATNRIVAEAEARGVEKLAMRRRAAAKVALDEFNDVKNHAELESEAWRAEMFASELREGADK
ncbi:TPA: hypothetical protein ACYEQG_003707 [Klebsiella pneumoniae]